MASSAGCDSRSKLISTRPPQHELPLLGELGFDSLVELGCILGTGEVSFGSLGDGEML